MSDDEPPRGDPERQTAERQPAPTLWTTTVPKDKPPGVLAGIDVLTDEQLAEAAQRVLREVHKHLDDLLGPYRTAVSDETLSQILD